MTQLGDSRPWPNKAAFMAAGIAHMWSGIRHECGIPKLARVLDDKGGGWCVDGRISPGR